MIQQKYHSQNMNISIISQYCINISQDLLLAEYLSKASALCHGLFTNEVKSLAFEFAAKLNLKTPTSWAAVKKDWQRLIFLFYETLFQLNISLEQARKHIT